jgi:hypothetical protein
MNREEIISTMSKPKSMSQINKYHEIYTLATGKRWNKCFCGNGFNTFFAVCRNYANALQQQINNEKLNNKNG